MSLIICKSWTNFLKRSQRFQICRCLNSTVNFKVPSMVGDGLKSASATKRATNVTSKLMFGNYGYKHCSFRYNVWPLSNVSRNIFGEYSWATNLEHPQHFSDLSSSCARCVSTDEHIKHSDINRNSWITLFPKQMQPYLILARVDRTIGYWVLFLPCSWSISLAAEAGSLPNFKILSLFLAGSLLMRSAGCVINDLWDADLDKKVARTSGRPLASGAITRFQGLVFLAGLLTPSLCILLSLNNYSIVLGASSLLLVTIYPLMKRITHWPQLFLGATFNWGALLGWTAVSGSLDLSICLPLYAAAINWTLIYDTIYSFQDIRYDVNAGIKSTGLLFGRKAKLYLSVAGAIMVANLLAVGINSSQTWPYYLGLLGVSSHIAWQLFQVDLSQPKDCLSKFKSNKWVGIILMLSIMASTLMKPKKITDEVECCTN